MRRVFLYTILLLTGIFLSQATSVARYENATYNLSLIFLAYIMIEVGLEFEIDRGNLKPYLKDYLIAATAAAFPWILCGLYLLWQFPLSYKEAMIVARFAAPTSAGIFFTMLAAAGLTNTWVFKRARNLAIFDDLDTIILLVPLQAIYIGWQMSMLVGLVLLHVFLVLAYVYLHRFRLRVRPATLLIWSVLIWAGTVLLDRWTHVHIEILLPAFAFGCMIRNRKGGLRAHEKTKRPWGLESIVKGGFMLLVGVALPKIDFAVVDGKRLLQHVVALTLLSNLGKCFPLFCYKKEASALQRLALSIAMFPRGEVGAGVLLLSIGYNLNRDALVAAGASLALNLALTGLFIYWVRLLVQKAEKIARHKLS